MTNIKEQEAAEGVRVYELAFHLLPTISESEVAVQFSHLKSLIEKRKGAFISEQAPALAKLMYEVPKTVKGVKKWYENAYFAWVKFSIDATEIVALEKEVKNFDSMLRYLLIKTVAEDTMAPAHLTAPKDARRATDGAVAGPVDAVAAEEAPAVVAEVAEVAVEEVEAKEEKGEAK